MADTPDVAALNQLHSLILKFGKKAPAWLQALVFFLLVMFFLYACFRFVGGDFAVRGRFTTTVVDESGKAKKAYARGLEVCLEDKMFATNSKGMFYAVLTPRQYYTILATGSLTVNLGRDELPLGEVKLDYARGSSSFEDKFLDPQLLAKLQTTPSPSFFEIVPAAYAGDDKPAPSSNRLFVEEIHLDARASNVKAVELELELGEEELDLRTVIGGEAGELPLVAGDAFDIGNTYFFPVTPSTRANTPMKIELKSHTRIFNRYDEEFDFALPAAYGAFERRGEGTVSTLRLIYLGPVDFVLSQDLDKTRIAKMRATLERAGIRLVDSEPSKSVTADRSNVLYIEKNVPASAALATLREIRNAGIPVHAIHYYMNQTSRPLRPYEILFVTDSAVRNPLTTTQIDTLLAARTQVDLARKAAAITAVAKK